jgi:hypothetical protein
VENRKRLDWPRIMKIVFYCMMGIQIMFGILWMIRNFTAVPAFGDSKEYLELGKTMILDEYRPVLYPLLLRGIGWVESVTSIPLPVILYTMQTMASFGAVLYGVRKLDEVILAGDQFLADRKIVHVFFSFYLVTIPMITFMNFTVLTDSLATSALILFLTGMVVFLNEASVKVSACILVTVSLMVQSLLRADRLYSCILVLTICLIIRLVRTLENRKRITIAVLAISLISIGSVRMISHMTQTPGIHGRVQTNLSFVLLDRIVWPNMAANYPDFPQEIQEAISIEDARKFDEHNNNVMYQMAPLLEGKVGQERAKDMYRQMAAIVFKNQTKKVLADIGEDILAMAVSPVSSLLHAYGRCEKNDSWNLHCMSTKTPSLTKNYNLYYQYSFVISIVFGGILSVIYMWKKESRNIGRAISAFVPYLLFGGVLTLWFCLGDGAPPNDRYAMIIYIAWALLDAALWGMWQRTPKAA